MTFNLIHQIDVPETEAKLAAYAKHNAQDIAQNAALSAQESASTEAQFAAQKEEARLRREAARKEEDDERREREEGRKEILDKIANSTDDPDKIQKVVLKKSTARRTAAERARQQDAAKVDNGAAPMFAIAGLKPASAPEPQKVYDPFAGCVMKNEHFTLQKTYDNPFFEKSLRTDPKITAGGYELGDYCTRAMIEAFAGLGVFIEDEVAGRETPTDAAVGTAAAAAAVAGGTDE